MNLNPKFVEFLSDAWNFICNAFCLLLGVSLVVSVIVFVCLCCYYKDKEAGLY